MGMDLMKKKSRPWYRSLGLGFEKGRVGGLPGPPLTISYKPEFFQRDFIGYIVRGMAGSGGWTKGEAELFASFVSKLNACQF